MIQVSSKLVEEILMPHVWKGEHINPYCLIPNQAELFQSGAQVVLLANRMVLLGHPEVPAIVHQLAWAYRCFQKWGYPQIDGL